MKVLHSYCLNYNIGDYALGIGVKNVLRHYLDIDLIGETNLQGRIFDEYYINEVVNKRYDLLVIGGGGIIHGSHWPNGWFWLIEKELIKSIKIPFIVYGVGDNYFDDEKIPERAIVHLRETEKYASFFSVRNDGSHKRVLEQTGINAHVVPDPGFHINMNTQYQRPVKEKYVLVQLANDKPEFRFRDSSRKKMLATELRSIIKTLAVEYRVIFTPHVYDDVVYSKEIADGIPNCEVWDFGYFAFDHSDKAIAYYQNAEFVIAMRGHGQIVPIGFNTPVVSIQNHPKHGGLMKELGLSQYNVNLGDGNFSSKLRNAVEQIIVDKYTLRTKYESINAELDKKTGDAFKIIKQRVHDNKR